MTWLHLIGGGVSNLHLAHQLAQTLVLPGEVVISEPNPEPLADKTLCGFWPAKEPLAIKPNHRWQQWGFSQAGQQVNHLAQHWTYCRYAGPDFARQVRGLIEAHPQILWRQETLSERPKARWVMDSRPPSLEQFQAFQSFVGFEVDEVQGESLGLMEDLRCEDHGISFVYRLPMGGRTLIELTRFETTPTPLDQLEQGLQALVGIDKFTIVKPPSFPWASSVTITGAFPLVLEVDLPGHLPVTVFLPVSAGPSKPLRIC